MYAAAGGASLASRQARRKQKQHHTNESMHQQFHKRFQQLQHQHAPACAEGYHYMRTSSSGLLSPSHLPSFTDLHGRGNTIDFSLQEQLLEVSFDIFKNGSGSYWCHNYGESEDEFCKLDLLYGNLILSFAFKIN
ncbi:hypothetical protein V9T40_011006 [Parthenolecanium corni]|uniref:Uncharacterized protein n=1 Tax=Parthenolecanium corni TaxID=536013 RepID=A0AAN9T746_9HEMI